MTMIWPILVPKPPAFHTSAFNINWVYYMQYYSIQ